MASRSWARSFRGYCTGIRGSSMISSIPISWSWESNRGGDQLGMGDTTGYVSSYSKRAELSGDIDDAGVPCFAHEGGGIRGFGRIYRVRACRDHSDCIRGHGVRNRHGVRADDPLLRLSVGYRGATAREQGNRENEQNTAHEKIIRPAMGQRARLTPPWLPPRHGGSGARPPRGPPSPFLRGRP